jgi:L-lactate dehydrogenase
MAYAMLIRESAQDIVLYDTNTAKVTAEVLDLAHGTQFTGGSSINGGDDISLTAGSDVIVITAGAKQKPGQTRLELAGVNVAILQDLLPKLLKHSPDAIFLLVTNPCDVLATVAIDITGLPASRVFSSGTVLDTSRLRWLLGDRLGVNTSSVHALIVGEHGDSEFPLWSQASIGPVPLSQWRDESGQSLTPAELDSIANLVKRAAYRVIEGKGATNYAIGLSGARIVEAILNDENAILPVSSLLTNYHGVSDVAMSVPTLVNRQGAARTIEVGMDDRELELFKASAAAIADSLKTVRSS